MTDPKDTTGRRAHERARLALQVSYRSAGSFLISYTVDLSRGGLFLETAQLLPVGSALDLTLQVPGAPPWMVHGAVVWLQEVAAPGRPVGMGIQFQDLEKDFGDLIDTLVRQFLGLRLLLSSPSSRTRSQLQRMLRAVVAAVVVEHEPTEGREAPPEGPRFDLAVIDLPDDHPPSLGLLQAVLGGDGSTAVLTIAGSPELRKRAIALGAQEVIDGPVSQGELRIAVLRALARPVILADLGEEDS